MADRSTPRFFEDSFARADSTDIGGQWTQSGTLQIVQQNLRQDGATALATAYAVQGAEIAASDAGSQYMSTMRVAIYDDSTTARLATTLLRFQGTPDTGSGYGVSLEWRVVAGAERLRLMIRKVHEGAWTEVSDVDITEDAEVDEAGSYEGVYQTASGRIYEVEGKVTIEAFANGSLRSTYIDNQYPIYSDPGNVGIFFEDNDDGVGGHILVKSVELAVIQEEEDTTGSVAYKWSFGDLTRQVRTHARRDSQDTLDDQYFKDIINEALQGFASQQLPAWWWEEKLTFTVRSGDTKIALPPNIMLHDDYVFDVVNRRPKAIIRGRDFDSHSMSPAAPTSGPVNVFLAVGRGSGGSIILEPQPAPSGDQAFTLRCWRQPAILINDDQIPDLPEALIPGLIWGAVYLYTLRDSDRTHIQSAARERAMWYDSARKLRNRFHSLSAPQITRSGFRLINAIGRAQGRFGIP